MMFLMMFLAFDIEKCHEGGSENYHRNFICMG